VVGKIRERDPPFFVFAIGMSFVDKTVDSFALADVALIVLALMFICDFLLELKEVRKEGVVGGSWL